MYGLSFSLNFYLIIRFFFQKCGRFLTELEKIYKNVKHKNNRLLSIGDIHVHKTTQYII